MTHLQEKTKNATLMMVYRKTENSNMTFWVGISYPFPRHPTSNTYRASVLYAGFGGTRHLLSFGGPGCLPQIEKSFF